MARPMSDRPHAPSADPATSDDGFNEPVFYLRERRSLGRIVLLALAVLVFAVVVIAMLVALL